MPTAIGGWLRARIPIKRDIPTSIDRWLTGKDKNFGVLNRLCDRDAGADEAQGSNA